MRPFSMLMRQGAKRASHSAAELGNEVKRKVYVEVYGCQMNVNDAELVKGILKDKYDPVDSPEKSDAALLMTCSIREAAEEKIWHRLDSLNALKQSHRGRLSVIGVLGCMAERLKLSLFEKRPFINLVCGPDSYRSLPRLLDTAVEQPGQRAVDVDLSMHETYEEELVGSVRNPLSHTAFVSIMRGCNNMCTFCIVPFTRGRERSRSPASITEEIGLLEKQGIREVTLLGQNVNSYNFAAGLGEAAGPEFSPGFTSLLKRSLGYSFVDLLDDLSARYPKIRFRFTSPHPRDFPERLLELLSSRPNIARHIHLPVQSGSDAVLERMRRGYTVGAYLDLVRKIREMIPGVGISTDAIAGFCGETEEDHQGTLRVFDLVAYDMAYMYAYSMREKTAAYRRHTDDVPQKVKQRRLSEIIDVFRRRNRDRLDTYIGSETVILIEGDSKKAQDHYTGRSSENSVVVVPKSEKFGPGDFVRVRILSRKGSALVSEATADSGIELT